MREAGVHPVTSGYRLLLFQALMGGEIWNREFGLNFSVNWGWAQFLFMSSTFPDLQNMSNNINNDEYSVCTNFIPSTELTLLTLSLLMFITAP